MLRSALRGLVARLGKVVEKDGLFEKPRERAPTAPLPERPLQEKTLQEASGKGGQAASGDLPKGKAASAKGQTAAPEAKRSAPEAKRSAPEGKSSSPEAKRSSPEAKKAAPAGKAPSTSAKATSSGDGAASNARISSSRPKEGCHPVDADGLRAALVPDGKPLIINHWATWCDPCVDELPRLVRSAAGVAGVAEFVGVSWDLFDHPGDAKKTAKKVGQFADSAGIGYASVLFTGEPETLYEIAGLDWHFVPQTLVLAPDGRVVWHKRGDLSDDDVFPLIKAARDAAG